MNGKAFSIMTQHEAFKLATYLAADDDDWTYNVAPFDPQRHTSPSATASHTSLARSWTQAGVADGASTLWSKCMTMTRCFSAPCRGF